MVISGGLSTEEKLVSKNPVVRKEGEKEANAGDIVRAARKEAAKTGRSEIDVIQEISQRSTNQQSSGEPIQTTGQEAIKLTYESGQSKTLTNLKQEEAQAVAASIAQKKKIQQEALKKKQQNLKKKDDTGTTSRYNLDSNNLNTFSVANAKTKAIQKAKEELDGSGQTPLDFFGGKPRRYVERFGENIFEFGSSAVRGARKVQTGGVEYSYEPESDQFLNIESKKTVESPLYKDKDVQTFLFVGTAPLAAEYAVGRGLIYGVSAFYTGKQIAEVAKDSNTLTPEKAADITFTALPLIFEAVPRYARDIYIKTGAKEIPAEQVFAESVLLGEETLPTSKSTAESIGRFEQTKKPVKVQKKVGKKFITISQEEASNLPFSVPEKYYVSTASPEKIKGSESTIGKKAASGIEDPGIYVTPKGEGSPYFLRLSREGTKYSFNPIESLKQKFNVPTVTEFEVQSIKKYPRSVALEPGFEGVTKYQESQAGTGTVFITKRSEIGQETVPRQEFLNPRSGRYELEQGTTEIEGIIPIKQKFEVAQPETFLGRIKGFEKYTEFKGRKVAIRESELILKSDVKTSNKKITAEKVAAEQKALSSQLSSSGDLGLFIIPNGSESKIPKVSSEKIIYDLSTPESKSIPRSRSSAPKSSSAVSNPRSSIVSIPSLNQGSSPSEISISDLSKQSSKGYGERSGGLIPPPPTIRKKRQQERKQKQGDSFEVQVRREGLFKTVGRAETLREAVSFGRSRVESTAAASFRIIGIDQQEDLSKIKALLSSKKFRESQKEAGVFIQRRRFRISSQGEKGEITFRGIAASRSKRSKKKRGVLSWV